MPTWAQGLLIGVAGLVLGLGGCATWLTNNGSGVVGSFGAIVFFGGLIAVPIGCIMFIVGVIKALFKQSN